MSESTFYKCCSNFGGHTSLCCCNAGSEPAALPVPEAPQDELDLAPIKAAFLRLAASSFRWQPTFCGACGVTYKLCRACGHGQKGNHRQFPSEDFGCQHTHDDDEPCIESRCLVAALESLLVVAEVEHLRATARAPRTPTLQDEQGDWVVRLAADIHELNPDYLGFEDEVAKLIRASAPRPPAPQEVPSPPAQDTRLIEQWTDEEIEAERVEFEAFMRRRNLSPAVMTMVCPWLEPTVPSPPVADLLKRAHARLVVCRDLTDEAQADCEVIRDLLIALKASPPVADSPTQELCIRCEGEQFNDRGK